MIRKFKDADLNQIMKIWLNTNIEAHGFISKEYWQSNFDMVKELLPTAEIYVYEEGLIKGFVGIITDTNNTKKTSTDITAGYIAGFFISRDFQSQGIGHKLLEMLQTKYSQLTLSVYTKNTQAINFYKAHHFTITNTSLDSNTNQPEHQMIWRKTSN